MDTDKITDTNTDMERNKDMVMIPQQPTPTLSPTPTPNLLFFTKNLQFAPGMVMRTRRNVFVVFP